MNCLIMERKEKILSALVECCSIRSIERMTDTHRDTIMRLLVRAGEGCQQLMNINVKGFHCNVIQVDDIWPFVKKKEKKLTSEAILGTLVHRVLFAWQAMNYASKESTSPKFVFPIRETGWI